MDNKPEYKEITETTFSVCMRYDCFIELKQILDTVEVKHPQLKEIQEYNIETDEDIELKPEEV